MIEFRAKMSDNGRIIIPATCRRLLHLNPGEELIIRIDDDEMRISSVKQALKKAQALIRKKAKDKNLLKQLKSLRHEDSTGE
jgi:AbrB family looped-hinge helix DNA binding protein